MFIFLDHFDRTRDSGFNSEIPSCACGILASSEHPSQQGLDLPSALLASDLNSGFLAQYGLDGPLDVYPDDGDEEEEEGAGDEGEAPEEELLGMPPAPSATSTTTKRKKREEMKQATIRQHYYPEGGWGFVVLTVAVLVQIISHGLQLSFGIFSLAIIRRWDESDTLAVGKKIILNFFYFHSPPVCSECVSYKRFSPNVKHRWRVIHGTSFKFQFPRRAIDKISISRHFNNESTL